MDVFLLGITLGVGMRKVIYNFLVNRKEGIRVRYHRFHDGTAGFIKVLSWLYLIVLNLAYYCLFFRFLGKIPQSGPYEKKRLCIQSSESSEYLRNNKKLSVENYVKHLSEYDIISFDVFDTLIFRPFSLPTDVFHLIGHKLGIMDFAKIRMWNEYDARIKHYDKFDNMEITLADIWKNIEEDVGIDANLGMVAELDAELSLCYANPFMLAVWQELIRKNKDIIVVSDMYLSEDNIRQLLRNAGYAGEKKIYVSSDYSQSKADGKLYKRVIKDYSDKKIIHVGDNPNSDCNNAKKNGLAIMPYNNTNKCVMLYRPFDMSALVGSAYRAVVSNYLYSGLKAYSMDYEYGFIYGGLFVTGYCNFIHQKYEQNGFDKILFLSRDGDTLKKAYDYLYPYDNTEYVYWSRKAATKLEYSFDKNDYFRRFIYHKVNQKYLIEDILKSMELDILIDMLPEWKTIWNAKKELWHNKLSKFIDLKAEDELTDKNGYLLRRFIEAKWDIVTDIYSKQDAASKKYYEDILSETNKVLAVDIGWAGSGAMTLAHLVEINWNIPCEITGVIAGTNTMYNAEPDASEAFLQTGKLISYMYSQSHNRDLLKKHDPSKDYNVFWELLLSSPTPQFKGFYVGDSRNKEDDIYISELDITLQFGKYDANQVGIIEIQKGILDFVAEYNRRFKDYSYMLNISGRDAYAPMLLASSYDERYAKAIEKRFKLEINVD